MRALGLYSIHSFRCSPSKAATRPMDHVRHLRRGSAHEGGGGGGGGATLRHPESIPRMAAALKHRGPDGECIVGHERARIGASRLAIMDLTTGDQPFQSPDGTIWMVCNGEIYNAPALRHEAGTWRYPF